MTRPNIEDLKPSRRPTSGASVTGSTAFRQAEIICYRVAVANPQDASVAKLIGDLIAELARAWGAD